MNRKSGKQGFLEVLFVLGVFTLLAIALVGQNIFSGGNAQTEQTASGKQAAVGLELLSREQIRTPETEEAEAQCLLIVQKDEVQAQNAAAVMRPMLHDMKITYKETDTDAFSQEMLSQYESAIVCVSDWYLMGDDTVSFRDFVTDGGKLLIPYMPNLDGVFGMMSQYFGITAIGTPKYVEGLHFTTDFMPGGTSRDWAITDAYDSAYQLLLDDTCEVYLESSSQNPTPLIWRYTAGEGTAVVCNMGYLEKAYRGFYAAAYSLLGDSCVYPVINGSCFYIDDFPSPVPEGTASYIQRDYNMEIRDFYTQVWWNDVYTLAQEHGIRYTGLVIEDYSDQTQGPFPANEETTRYNYFGNMLLEQGGEIGFHGYNHMPLVLEDFDFQDMYDEYKQWHSYEDMKDSITELNRFCSLLFPDEQFQVYVPPSNVLSEDGRKMLAAEFPQIKAIASFYLEGSLAYEQEFGVGEDGIVNTPRITSGYVLDDYMRLLELSELSMHYVNTHFQHPDDVLDEDRGAALGWEELFDRFNNFVEWLEDAAPDMRNLTGSELAGAVQRYDQLRLTTAEDKNTLTIRADGFVDEGWAFVRFNEGQIPEEIEGGRLQEIGDRLYLLELQDELVRIEFKTTEKSE